MGNLLLCEGFENSSEEAREVERMDMEWKERQTLKRLWRVEAQKFHKHWHHRLSKQREEQARERNLLQTM